MGCNRGPSTRAYRSLEAFCRIRRVSGEGKTADRYRRGGICTARLEGDKRGNRRSVGRVASERVTNINIGEKQINIEIRL